MACSGTALLCVLCNSKQAFTQSVIANSETDFYTTDKERWLRNKLSVLNIKMKVVAIFRSDGKQAEKIFLSASPYLSISQHENC
jgi:hypothetical protein